MRFARINDAALHYAFRPAPEGAPTIAFANSLGCDFRIWDDVVHGLGDECGCILYDKRGHGLSDIGAPPYRMDDHVADLAGLLDHLGVSGAVICGLSVGGMIAQGLSTRRPDLVRALVLCGTAHRIGSDEMWDERIAAMRKDGIASLAGAILERWFTPEFRTEDNPAFRGCRNMLLRSPPEGYAGTCAALRDADYTRVARHIAVPTLCIVGEQDGSTPPELVGALADLVPGARFEIVPGAAHLPCIEQPETLVRHIRAFLADLPA